MKEKGKQFIETYKQNKKKTGILLLAMFFLFIALGLGIYLLAMGNEPSQKVAKERLQEEPRKVEPKKKALEEKKESEILLKAKSTEEKREGSEEASKPADIEKKTENKTSELGKPTELTSKPVASATKPSTPASQQKPVEPQKPAHTHDFQPVYTQKWVVDQPAWTETVETPVYGMVEHTICSTCGADISGFAGQHLDETMHGGYYSNWVQEQTGTTTETIQHPEVGHYENVLSCYQCSCGATK